jgi:hypothetical protein
MALANGYIDSDSATAYMPFATMQQSFSPAYISHFM